MFQLLGVTIVIASSVYFAYFVYQTIGDYDFSTLLSPSLLLGVLVCGFVYALIIPVTAWAWKGLLRSVGSEHRLAELTLILGLTQPAKYLPGNVGQHIGRAAMAFQRRMPATAFFGTVVLEALLAAAAGLAIGVICLGLSSAGLTALPEPERSILLISMAALALGILVAPAVKRLLPPLVDRLLPLVGAPKISVVIPGRAAIYTSVAAYAVNYILVGIGLCIIALLTIPGSPPDLMLFTGAFAISWLVGFFTPGAPAGLGVREGVMAMLLGPASGTDTALTIIIALRLATVLGDGLALALGTILLVRERRRAAPLPQDLSR